MAFLLIQANDPLFGYLKDDMDSQEKKMYYTLKVDMKYEKAYINTDTDYAGKSKNKSMLLSLPDCDYFCVKNMIDKNNDLADGIYSFYKYMKTYYGLDNLHLNKDKNSLIISMGISISDSSKDACLPESNDMTAVVPEPGAVLLGAIGAGIVGWLRRRKTF